LDQDEEQRKLPGVPRQDTWSQEDLHLELAGGALYNEY